MSKYQYLYKTETSIGEKFVAIQKFNDRSGRSMLDLLIEKEYKRMQRK